MEKVSLLCVYKDNFVYNEEKRMNDLPGHIILWLIVDVKLYARKAESNKLFLTPVKKFEKNHFDDQCEMRVTESFVNH